MRSMVLRAIQNPERWMAALMLDPETGLDPPGVKIRAAQGIDAAQKFIEGYWLWYGTFRLSDFSLCYN